MADPRWNAGQKRLPAETTISPGRELPPVRNRWGGSARQGNLPRTSVFFPQGRESESIPGRCRPGYLAAPAGRLCCGIIFQVGGQAVYTPGSPAMCEQSLRKPSLEPVPTPADRRYGGGQRALPGTLGALGVLALGLHEPTVRRPLNCAPVQPTADWLRHRFKPALVASGSGGLQEMA